MVKYRLIWNSAGYYPMLMTWVQKTNNSQLHGTNSQSSWLISIHPRQGMKTLRLFLY
ncbi:hypothetical protein DM860_000385 [Cuscuta australis]|uniref:Uncharacterized protein n=1 Tax=Cuscuta australis TaxID=267555 RepID=A0A328CZE2_9ASTE|nr:hypothetical protein DM860_000385 [Cuscuta australis]